MKLEQRSLAGKISRIVREQSERIPGLMMRRQRRVVSTVNANVFLQVEIEGARLLVDTTNYNASGSTALAGNARWDQPASDPRGEALKQKDAVYLRTGAWPNTLALGHKVVTALLTREDVREDARGVRNLVNEPLGLADLKHYFDVDKIVPLRGLKSSKAGGDLSLIWGDIAWLGCVDQQTERKPQADANLMLDDMMFSDDLNTSQTWGAGLRLRGYPMVDPEYYDPSRTSWIYGLHTYDTPSVVTKKAAHLWTTVIG